MIHCPRLARRAEPILLAVAILLITGCGSDLPRTIPVRGKVTFDGGPCPAAGTVWFLPVTAGEGSPLRPATAEFDTGGTFQAGTYNPGDGLLPGKYQVRIDCYQTPPNMEGKPVVSHVPPKYQNAQTSGWELEITGEMQSQEIDFDVMTK